MVHNVLGNLGYKRKIEELFSQSLFISTFLQLQLVFVIALAFAIHLNPRAHTHNNQLHSSF